MWALHLIIKNEILTGMCLLIGVSTNNKGDMFVYSMLINSNEESANFSVSVGNNILYWWQQE